MAPTKAKGELLARVNFPPYTLQMLTPRHVLVAGGGGKSRTGVANVIEIYELESDGKTCRASPATRYPTGDKAIMNCVSFHNGKYYVLAAGLEGFCQIYQLKFSRLQEENEAGDSIAEKPNGVSNNVRKRKKSERGEEASENNDKSKGSQANAEDQNSNSLPILGFTVQPLQCIKTDECINEEDAFQKAVRVSPDKKTLVTAGANGNLKFWQYPEMKELCTIKAHKEEVDDIDVSPDSSKVVSASRDGHCYLWKVKEQKQLCELGWKPSTEDKYRCRNCRFSTVENEPKKMCLFTTHVPVMRPKKPLPSYIVKWDLNTYLPQKVQNAGTDFLSAMAVSDDGRFVAVGTSCGTVDVYISFSLQRLLHVPGAHSFFISGLEFVPPTAEATLASGDYDASVVSIAVDNQIKIHHIPHQATISIVWVMLMFVILLFLVFSLMSYLEL